MGSIEYNMESMERFMSKTSEFLYAHWYQELGTYQADITICLENEKTGEIRELWYRRVDESNEEEVENKEFKKFFNEHHCSLVGRKHFDDVLNSSLVAERWIPDNEHRQERLVLCRRVEKHGLRKIAVLILVLEDCNTCNLRELWHARVKMSDNLMEVKQRGKLEKIVEEHFIALKGRDCSILTVNFAAENGS